MHLQQIKWTDVYTGDIKHFIFMSASTALQISSTLTRDWRETFTYKTNPLHANLKSIKQINYIKWYILEDVIPNAILYTASLNSSVWVNMRLWVNVSINWPIATSILNLNLYENWKLILFHLPNQYCYSYITQWECANNMVEPTSSDWPLVFIVDLLLTLFSLFLWISVSSCFIQLLSLITIWFPVKSTKGSFTKCLFSCLTYLLRLPRL